MSACHLILIFIACSLIDRTRQEIAPVFTPDNESLVNNHKQHDQLEKSSVDNLQAAEIVLPVVTVSAPLNQTASKSQQSNQTNGKLRKRNNKYQNNNKHRTFERKSQFIPTHDSSTYNLDAKKSQLNEWNNALLLQLANQKFTNQPEAPEKYNPIVGQSNNNDQLPFQLVPVYANESPAVNNNLLVSSNDPNQLAVQLYLRKLAHLAQLQKHARSADERQTVETPKITKRVSNQPLVTSSTTNLQQLANQLLQANQQPVYTLLQPPQSQTVSPLYLALQPSFQPYQIASSTNRDTTNSQPQNAQVSSLIETGDKIFAKIKQWSTDVFNPKSSLNRQISEVLGVVSDVALITLVGVPVLSLLSLGVSSLVQPLSQLNRKADRAKLLNKQKIKSEEKKDNKDEKTAKSDTNLSQKNTKMLDKRSRFVSLMERAGDEFTHFKNLVEIAKNFELAFKKYNVQERECKYRVLCEVSSSNQAKETDEQVSSNLLREGRKIVRRSTDKMMPGEQLIVDKSEKCDKNTTNCSSVVETVKLTSDQSNQTTKKVERNRSGGLRNLIRGLIDENKDSFIGFVSTIDQLMNRAQRSNFFSYLINEEQLNQAFKSDSKLFKTIAERSKQLQDKLRDFLDNLNIFQQVVTKDAQSLEGNKKTKYRMFDYYNLARSKRDSSLSTNQLTVNATTTTPSNQLDNASEFENVDVSGLKFVLTDLIEQLKFEQNQDNLLLPLSRIWLNPFLNAYEYGQRNTANQCKARFFKCQTNFIGLHNGNFEKRIDLETVISNNHLLKQSVLKKKPNQAPVQKL